MTATRIVFRVVTATVVVASVIACADTRNRGTAPQPELDAYLEVPNPLPAEGAKLLVMIRIAGPRAHDLASFTGRITYDTAGLTFIGETALTDGAIRVSNPTAGLIRTAAIRAQGFGNAPVAAYEFIVKSRSAIATMALTVEEVHDAKLGNATANVRLLPMQVIR